MQEQRLTRVAIATALALAAAMASLTISAQPAGFKRIPVQDQDLSMDGRHAVQAIAEFEPGVSVGRHTHPGEEVSYVLAGELQLLVDGRPPVTVKAGEALFVPAGVVHDAKNVGTSTVRVLATYIVKKGEPVASPAK